MTKNVLIIAAICSLGSGLLPDRAPAMLPVGNDDHRRFYKDQEWIWTSPEGAKLPAAPGVDRPSAATKPNQPVQASLAFTMPPQVSLPFTMPTHPPETNLAFTMLTHPPETKLAFTM